jgi:mono/diheme cytochrome c family protein
MAIWIGSSHRLVFGWLLGLATVGVVAAIAAIATIYGGLYNTSATSPHLKVFAWAVHKTMIGSVRRRAVSLPPPNFDGATLLAGMSEYETHCIACHGGPGIDRARWASAMLPTPPFLLGSSHHWSRSELYTIVHGGVKMTGMPAWGKVEPSDRIENVVTLIQAMPKLTPSQFGALRARAAASGQGDSAPSAVKLSD